MFGAHVGVTSFAMFYGFVERVNPFDQMQASSSHLRKLQRRFRMFQSSSACPSLPWATACLAWSMASLTLPMADGWAFTMDTNERSKRSQNEDTTVEFADQLCLPPGL